MYYDLSNEVNTANVTSLSLGPIYISSEQIMIGIIVDLFALIPSILLVQFFRRIRARQQHISPLHQALYKIEAHMKIKVRRQKSRLTFPWWCLFVVYGLCLILTGISIFFIIVRGIEFGDLKSQKWLTSILTGLFSSILLTQPLKILSLAIFFSCFCRNTNDDQEADEYFDENQIYFEYLHSIDVSIFTYRPPIRANRLTEGEIVSARQQRLKEIHMWSILREIFTYLCFLILLYTITYSNQNSNSYFQVDHLRKYLFNSGENDFDYSKISTINDYWNWLEGSFVSNIHAQEWYNGDSPRNLSGFINDKTNRLIGWPMMRQLRIKSDLCSYPKLRLNCIQDYTITNEEKDSFEPGWINETTEEYSSSILQAFQYQSSEELGTYAYSGYSGKSGIVFYFCIILLISFFFVRHQNKKIK
jgi:polycystin 1L2